MSTSGPAHHHLAHLHLLTFTMTQSHRSLAGASAGVECARVYSPPRAVIY